MNAGRLPVVAIVALAAATIGCDVITPTNPLDPLTPAEQQARASLVGRVIVEDTADAENRALILRGMRVGLLDQDGRRVADNGVAVQRELQELAELEPQGSAGRAGGSFRFDELVPGTYTVVVDFPPAAYRAPTSPTVTLLPSQQGVVDDLTFVFEPVGEEAGPGQIAGSVRVEGGALGQHRVSLFERRGETVVFVRAAVTDGDFSFAGLGFARYAVVVESEGNTPVYRLGLRVAPDGTEGGQLQYQLSGDSALVVHPLTSAVTPQLGDPTVVLDEGEVLVRGAVAPVLVLPFVNQVEAALGITGMRLSTTPTFTDSAGAAVPFSPHQATTAVALPAADGRATIFAQFEARSADNAFAFVSPIAQLTVTKDTTPPTVVETRAVGLALDGTGAALSPSRTLALALDVSDATSGVDAVGVAFDVTPAVLDDITAQPGLNRVQRQLTSDRDGLREITVVVEDRAGNRSQPTTLTALIDTLAPAPTLAVRGAAGGVLRSRNVVIDVDTDIASDDVLVAVGLEGAVDEDDLGPLGAYPLTLPSVFGHGAAVTFEVVAVDAVGNRRSATQTVTLDLRGAVRGVVSSDAVPSVLASVAGATVTLTTAQGAVVGAPVVVGADGAFALLAVPEGRNYTLRAELAGHAAVVTRAIAVDLDVDTDVGELGLDVLRTELRGRALRSDVVGDATAHGGVAVTARLVSPTGRTFSDTVTTDAGGAYALRAAPRTLAGESFVVSAAATDYGAASTTTSAADAVVSVADLFLPRARGDFDVCRTADPGCATAQFFSENTVDVRLRDATDVVAVHVGLNGAATTRLLLGAGNRSTVSMAGLADGEVVLSVQAEKLDGARSEVLFSTIVRDTQPPSAVVITRRASAQARDARFTADTFVDLTVAADAGQGAVAPLAAARAVVADAAPPLPQAGFVSCAHDAVCRVALPNQERLLRVFVFSCDAANNCAAPASTFVIRDVTPPSLGNGAGFSVAAAGSVVESGVVVLPAPFYDGVIQTGAARTLGGQEVVDESGAAVADVWGYRLSLVEANLPLAPPQGFVGAPAANESRTGADIVVPPLPSGEQERTVFAQLQDAAGNLLQTPIGVRVIVDATGPTAVLTVNGGAAVAALAAPFSLFVPIGAEAPRRIEIFVDTAAAQSFTLPLTGSERLTLSDQDGVQRVVMNAFDRVGNVTRTESIVTLDRGPPRLDSARCVSASCTDSGFGQLLSRALDGRIDIAVTTFDALSAVTAIEVTSTPSLPGGPQLVTIGAGQIVGVRVQQNQSSTLALVPIDALGNRGTAFVRAVRHDTLPPDITSVAIEAGAARTKKTQVTVTTTVAGGDAVELAMGAVPCDVAACVFTPFRVDEFFSFAGADGARDVCVRVRDAAGNISDATCDSIELDRTLPNGTVTVAAPFTGAATTTATLAYPADTAEVAASTASLTCDPSTTPYASAAGSPQGLPVSLDGGDGARTVTACFRDLAGNVAQATTTVTVDRTPPSVTLTLAGGAAFATTSTPTAEVTVSENADGIAVAVDQALTCSSATYVPFTTTPAVNLGATQGNHVVRACVRDRAGNVSAAPAVASIVLDSIAPAATVSINGGSAFTRQGSVTVTVASSPDTAAIAVANAASLNCGTAAYTAFSPSFVHQLSASDGNKTVAVCVRDQAGLTSAASAQATITVDTTPPSAVLTVANGAATSPIATVQAVLSAAVDVNQAFVSGGPVACDTAPFVALPGNQTFNVTLPLPNTINVVTACLKDAAGNISIATDSIFFENAAGDALIIVIDGGAATTRSRNIDVSLFRPSTDFVDMKVQEAQNLDCANPVGYVAFNDTQALTLSAGVAPAEGQRTVSACVRSAANVTRFATATIFVDSFRPAGTVAFADAVSRSPTVNVQLTNSFAANEVVTVALSETSLGSATSCSGNFEPFLADRTFTYTSGDGVGKTLFACLRDPAGNTTQVEVPAGARLLLDSTPPTPVTISTPGIARSRTVTVALAFPSDAVEVALAEGGLQCETAQGYAAVPPGPSPTASLVLSAGDGTRTIAACFRDVAGNTSQATTTTTLDQTPPAGTVLIAGGAAFATSTAVTVALQNAADVTGMALIESATAPSCPAADPTQEVGPGYVATTLLSNFTLSSADGTKTVHVCLRDRAGNVALGVPDTIILDRTPPVPTVLISDGASDTASRSVTVAIGVGVHTDTAAFAIAESAIVCNAVNLVYQPFAATVPFVLSQSPGPKNVLVCLKDQAGNVSGTAGSDGITLDVTAPIGGALAINDGDGFVNGETSVGLTLSWTSPGDVAAVKVGEGAVDCQSPTGFQTAAPASTSFSVASFPLSAGDGTKLVLGCLRDAAGNIATVQDTTVRDLTAPVVTTVACAGCSQDAGTTFSRASSVVLAVTADEQGSGLAAARVAVDAGAEAPLALVNGTVTVNGLAEGSRTLRVKLFDGAGNVSTTSRDVVVVVDQTAPSLTSLLINGSAAADNATSSRTVNVAITGASADVAHMAVADGNGTAPALSNCALATYTPFTAEQVRTLLPTDGDKAVSVCLRDRAGNTSAAATTSVVRLDTLPVSLPATPVVVLDGDGFVQTETTVTVRLDWITNGDARSAKVQEGVVDCSNPAGYVALPANASDFDVVGVGVSAGDGQKLIGVCFRDAAGNTSAAQGLTVRDGTAPVVTSLSCPACTVDNGVIFSRSTTAALLVSAIEQGAGVADAAVTRNGTNVTLPVAGGTVTVPSLAQGANTVVVRLTDRAGNVTPSGSEQTIALTVDTIAPTLAAGGLRLNGGSAGGATNSALVTATIVGAPADATAMAVVEAGSAPSCAAATYVPLQLASSLQLSAGDGTKSVFVCLRDRAGNTQAAATQATIRLDTVPPSLPAASVAIQDGGDGFLTSVAGGVNVSLAWNVADDVVAYKIAEETVDCASEPYIRPVGINTVTTFLHAALPLSAVDGTKRVVVCFKDLAGNVSVGQDTTTLDVQGPNGAITVNGGAAFTTDPSENVTVTARMATDTGRFAVVETANAACTAATLACAGATYETFTGSVVDGQLQATKVVNLSGAAAASEGQKCIEACFEDAAGNRTTTASIARITFDKTAPTAAAADVNLVGTPAGATTRTSLVSVAVAVAPADTASMRVSEDNTFAGGAQAFVPFTTSAQPLLLTAGDGTKNVFVQLRDQAGNVGSATQKTITVDSTPPENVAVNVNAGAAFATTTSVTLSLAATNATQMQVATDGVPDTEPFVAFVTSVAATLPAGDGPKLVVVRFRDAVGNTSTASDAIDLDTTPPVGGTVSINDGAAVTNNTNVTLTIAPPTDAATMSIGGGPFVAVSTAALTAIASTDCAPGVLCKTVSVVFRDAAGNSGTPVSDTISLDTVVPSSVAVALASSNVNDTAGFTTGLTVTATFSFATSAGNATSVKHGEGAVDCGTAAGYVALGGVSPLVVPGVTLTSGDGQKSYVACFRDAAGNVASASTQITMDRTRPFGVITLNDGASHTTSTSATVTVIPAADDVTRVAFVNSASAPDCSAIAAGSFATLTTTMAHTLTAGDATKTVHACFRDTAGNTSTLPSQDTIVLDGTPPTVALTIQGTGVDATFTRALTTTVTLSSLPADARAIAVAEGTLGCATAAFEAIPVPVPASLARSFLLANAGDGSRTVSACVRDEAGNLSGVNGTTATITVDQAPPQVTVSINAGATFATASTVTATLGATPSNDPLRAVFSPDPALDCATQTFTGVFGSLPASTVTTLSSGDGEKFVVACFQDRAGNLSRASDAIVLDTTAPVGVLALAQGAEFTTSTSVTTNFSGVSSDVTQFSRANGATLDCATATYAAFVDGTAFTLTGGADGARTVSVCLRDAAGNTTRLVDTIGLDLTNPSVAFTVVRRGGGSPVASFTNTRDVSITVASIATDARQFAIADNSIDCGTVSYDALPSPLPSGTFTRDFTLAAGSDGSRTVAVCVKDAAGRTNGTTGTSASITLDTLAPTVNFAINAGATVTNNIAVTLGHTITSTPSTEPVRTFFSRNVADDCAATSFSGAFASLGATSAANLASGSSGTRFIVGCVQDQAGNITRVADDIEFDNDRPVVVAGSIECSECNVVDGVAFTNAAALVNLDVSFADVDTDFVLAMVTNDNGGVGAADRVCTSSATCLSSETCVDFPINAIGTLERRCAVVTPADSASVARLLNVQGQRTLFVAAEDVAGNYSAPVPFTIVRDTVAPTATFILATGTTDVVNTINTIDDSGTGGTVIMRLNSAHTFAVGDRIVVTGTNVGAIDYDATYTIAQILSSTEIRTLEVDPGNDDDPLGSTGTVTQPITRSQSIAVRDLAIGNEVAPPSGVGRLGTFQASALSTFADASTLSFLEIGAPFTSEDAFFVSLTAGDGGKDVFVRFVDNAGNAVTASRTVTLDTTAPSDPLFANATTLINAVGSVTVVPLAVASVDSHLVRPRPYTITGFASASTIVDSDVSCTSSPVACTWNGSGAFVMPAASFNEGESRLRLSGVDTAGNTSATDLLIVRKDTIAPVTPSISRLVPGNGRISMTWSPSTSSDVAGYKVHYTQKSGSCSTTVPYDGRFADQGDSPVDVGLNLNFTLTGLPNETEFCLAVTAYDAANNEVTSLAGASNNPRSITPYEVPPVEVGSVTSARLGIGSDLIRALSVRDNMMYVAVGGRGLIELDVTNVRACQTVSDANFAACVGGVRIASPATLFGTPAEVVLQGKMAFIADNASSGTTGGVHVYSLDEGATPTFVTRIALANARRLVVQGARLAVLYTGGVDIYDIGPLFNGTAAAPTLLGTIAHAGTPTDTQVNVTSTTSDLDMQGSQLVVTGTATNYNGRVLNIGNPAAPTRVTTTDSNDYEGGAVAFYGDNVAVVDGAVLTIKNIDIEFPLSEPSALGGNSDIVVHGPYIYTLGSGALDVFELAEGEVRFVGRHPGVGGLPNTGSVSVDRGRVYFTGGNNSTIIVVDLHSSEGASRVGVEPESIGSNAGAIWDNQYFEGFGRMGPMDRVGYRAVGVSLLPDMERCVVDGNIAAFGFRDSNNGDRLFANIFVRSEVVGAFATGVTNVTSVTMENTVGGAVELKWPWLLLASRNNSTTSIDLEVYDLRSGTELLHDTMSVQTTTTSTNCRVEPNAIAVHRGFVYVAVDNDGASNACAGLYRGNFNGRTGIVAANATKVVTDDVLGVAGTGVLGTRLAFWRDAETGANAEIQVHSFSTSDGVDTFSTSNVVALTGTVSGFNQRQAPVFIGENVFTARTALFQFAQLSFSAPSHAISSTSILSTAVIQNGRSISVAGDSVYIQQEDRLLEVHRIR